MDQSRIRVIQGDITQLRVDAIVNAANSSLLGGGGVDGAIHTAAGSQLLTECLKLEGCETGDAKVTQGYNLPAKWVIHTAGPVWKGGGRGEDDLLASCYRRCLAIAAELAIETIAFPAISTGVYGFPFDRAARIAVTEILTFLEGNRTLKEVTLICFSQGDFISLARELQQIMETWHGNAQT